VQAIRADHGHGFYKTTADDHGRLDLEYGRSDVSSKDGGFELAVMPGVAYTLDVHERNQWFCVDGARFGQFTAPRETIALTILPEELATSFVVGRVVDQNGGAVADARFQVKDTMRLGTVGVNTPGTRRSDADGRFRIGPVPARAYVLSVIPCRQSLPFFESHSFALKPDEVLDLGQLVLPIPARLSVRLHRSNGEQIGRAYVSLRVGKETKMVFAMDGGGLIEQSVTPGRYTLEIYGETFPTREEAIELRANDNKQCEYTIPPAIAFAIRCRLPLNEQSGEVVMRSYDGTTEFHEQLASDKPWSDRWNPRLSFGEHTAELRCASGREYVARFCVLQQTSLPGREMEPVELQWSLKR
jgi:hypothetical protein